MSYKDVLDFFAIEADLTEQQKLTQQSVREFVSRDAKKLITDCYRREEFPMPLIKTMGQMGLLGSNLSGYDGLLGLDNISYGLIMQELERCDSGLRSFASVQGSLVMFPIHAFGSEEQKNEYLPKLASGDMVGCFGLTESEGGSDPSSMKTWAEKKENKWILNGSKMWITNGNLAQIAIVWANSSEGIIGFIVPTNTKGFSAKKMTNKLSLRASVTSELYFEQIELPLSAQLPKANGLKSPLSCLTQARFGIAFGVIGAAEACFEEACNFAKNRILFQKPLITKQLIQVKLAKCLTQITNSKLLAHRLGQLKDQKRLDYGHVSMAKQHNCKAALEVARTCRDILGANGIMDEYQTMRHMCNLETVITYEGTDDIHSLIVGSKIAQSPAF